MQIGLNIFEACREFDIDKLVNVGTVCGYPKHTEVPFKETDLFNGYPEETNAPYGVAKRALWVLGKAYKEQYNLDTIYLLLVNLYGQGDHFKGDDVHVIPALIRKFVKAKKEGINSVILWGTGKPTREFLFVKDAADAIVQATTKLNDIDPLNIGTGIEISIKELAAMIADKVGYEGNTYFDIRFPDGQPRRCLDVFYAKELINWKAKIGLNEGLDETIKWYLEQSWCGR